MPDQNPASRNIGIVTGSLAILDQKIFCRYGKFCEAVKMVEVWACRSRNNRREERVSIQIRNRGPTSSAFEVCVNLGGILREKRPEGHAREVTRTARVARVFV